MNSKVLEVEWYSMGKILNVQLPLWQGIAQQRMTLKSGLHTSGDEVGTLLPSVMNWAEIVLTLSDSFLSLPFPSLSTPAT